MSLNDREYYQEEVTNKMKGHGSNQPNNEPMSQGGHTDDQYIELPPEYKIVRKTSWSLYELVLYVLLGCFLLFKRHSFIETMAPQDIYIENLDLKLVIIFVGFILFFRWTKHNWVNNKV